MTIFLSYSRTTQEELDEETAALQREAEMSVEDLKKLYSKIQQQVSPRMLSLVLSNRHDDIMTHVWLKSENGDDESQNEQAEVESSALPTILADIDEEDDDTDDVDYKEWVKTIFYPKSCYHKLSKISSGPKLWVQHKMTQIKASDIRWIQIQRATYWW